nr:MAG TPA: hypothetical protein [Caudoviricetes sp.]
MLKNIYSKRLEEVLTTTATPSNHYGIYVLQDT